MQTKLNSLIPNFLQFFLVASFLFLSYLLFPFLTLLLSYLDISVSNVYVELTSIDQAKVMGSDKNAS